MSSNSTAPSSSPGSTTQAESSSQVTSAQPSTTNVPTTSIDTSPATSAAPATSQSSPAQTSAVATTAPSSSSSPAASASSASASAAAPTITSSSTFTSQVATTLFSTDPGGSVVYLTTTVPQVISTTVSSPSTSSSSSSHTGVIVGAVVGGVAGIAILALLLFCIRKRVRKDEFDGNFDPDRVVGHIDGGGGTLPQVDLADEVTPFPQSYTDQGNSSMRQYGGSPYHPVASSLAASGQSSTELYPAGAAGAGASTIDAQSRQFMQPGAGSGYAPQINMYGAGPMDWHSPRPGASPPPSTSSYNTTSTRAAKEREALGRSGQGQGLGLATQEEVAEGSGDVVVHRDAGRAPVEEPAPPTEIPPAYESIPRD